MQHSRPSLCIVRHGWLPLLEELALPLLGVTTQDVDGSSVVAKPSLFHYAISYHIVASGRKYLGRVEKLVRVCCRLMFVIGVVPAPIKMLRTCLPGKLRLAPQAPSLGWHLIPIIVIVIRLVSLEWYLHVDYGSCMNAATCSQSFCQR